MQCPPSLFAFSAPCAPGPGGIKAVCVANPEAVIISMNAAAGTVTLSPATSGAKPFYRWECAPGQSTLEVAAQINDENNVRYYATDLAAVLNGFKPTSAGALLLSKLTRMAVIVETNDGSAWFVGSVFTTSDNIGSDTNKARGMEVTNFQWSPGQAKGDATRATISAHLDGYVLPLSVSLYSNLVNA